MDLPKEGTYIKDNKEDAKNYLWSKEYQKLNEKIETAIDMNQELNEMIKSYTTVLTKTIDVVYENIGRYKDFLSDVISQQLDGSGETLENSMMIEQGYSIEKKEKYVEVIDSVELSNDDEFLQAA